MTFMKGAGVELRVLEGTQEQVRQWTDGVMSHLTTEHLFTGSFPMRYIDIREEWERERKGGDVLFAVYAPKDRFIGTCGLHSHREIYRSWEARFLLFDAQAVGKGFGLSVTRLLVEYAFSRLNAHRVWLGVSADNSRAVKCYLNAGFTVEGTLRDELYYGGKYHDVYRMSLLESEVERCLKPQ